MGEDRRDVFGVGRCSSPNSSVGIAAPSSSHGVDVLSEVAGSDSTGATETDAQIFSSEPQEI